MKYPIQIDDEHQLCRLIREISRPMIRETVNEVLVQTGAKKPMIIKAECERRTSHAKIENAVKNRELKFIAHGRNLEVSTIDFENWLTENKLIHNESTYTRKPSKGRTNRLYSSDSNCCR